MEPIHPLLASTRSGLDQPATSRNESRNSCIEDGCLNGSRGVIFPGSHRGSIYCSTRLLAKTTHNSKGKTKCHYSFHRVAISQSNEPANSNWVNRKL